MSDFFSFHIGGKLPEKNVPGLLHSERLFIMRLGFSVTNPFRYRPGQRVCLAHWEDEKALRAFLDGTSSGWHIRLRFYRRWGSVSELPTLPENTSNPDPDDPVVGITLARLRLRETLRFLKWGRPVEKLVRDHPGKIFALAAMRPLNTLSTFSIWKNEREMIDMVKGDNVHGRAIGEQLKDSFHHEFTTMRFQIIGNWQYPPKI